MDQYDDIPTPAYPIESQSKSLVQTHNEIFQYKKCSIHPDTPFTFFCFDDKTFLCTKCFKEHKKHRLEIKEDLQLKAALYSKPSSENSVNILDKYNSFVEGLIEIKQEIDKEIAEITNSIEEVKKNESSLLNQPKANSIFELSYQEYSKISGFAGIGDQISGFIDKISEIADQIKTQNYKNFHWISNEVSVIDNTPFHEGFSPDIMLGKAKGPYYLGEGTVNHRVTFDLGSRYFVKEIKLSVHDFECSLKNFKISVKNDNDQWELIGEFQSQPFSKEIDYQYFQVGCEGRVFKFDFLDNWGPGGGNYILVKKIFFNVGELK